MDGRLAPLAVALGLAALPVRADEAYRPGPENLKARQWFQEARFGLFIHWGVYSVLGSGEWVMHQKRMTSAEYERIEGVRPIDVLLKETPKDLLGLELDTFWASIAGVDPVKMVETHSGRVPLVHLKDKAKATPVQYDEGKVPKDAFKEVGQGEVDYAKFLPAAAKAGVKYYYVEQDYCAGSPLDSLRASRQALSTLTAAKRG